MYESVLDFYKGDEVATLKFFTMPIYLFDNKTPMQMIEEGGKQKEKLKDWIRKNMVDDNIEVARGLAMKLRYKVVAGVNIGHGQHYKNIHFTCEFPGGISHSFSFTTKDQEVMDEFITAMSVNKNAFEQGLSTHTSQHIFKYLISQLGFDIRNGEISK